MCKPRRRNARLGLLLALLLWPIGSAWATITNVQSATSATTSITLNGVTAGNTLVLIVSFYRDVSTGAAFPTPSDSNGTVAVATSPTPAIGNAHDLGTSIFYVTNANAGTHTFTLASISESHATLVEFSPMAVSSFDVATSALTNGNSSAQSQVTGTTSTIAQASELVIIGCVAGSNSSGGVTDIGWTDPVSGFTTLQKVINLRDSIPLLHAWKEVSAVGTQAATFNWSNANAFYWMQAAIATFKATVTSSGNTTRALTGVGQ